MVGFDLSQLTWQHGILTLLVLVLIYCLIMGCRFNLELLESGPVDQSPEESNTPSDNAPAAEAEENDAPAPTENGPVGYSGNEGSISYANL